MQILMVLQYILQQFCTPENDSLHEVYVVILSGDYQGQVMEVLECQRKKWKVKIIINNSPLTYDFAIVCRLTQVV